MNAHPNIPCLVLACGNRLRTDDGVALELATWAEEHFRNDPRIRVVAQQQWTPELAFELAHAQTALFLDCSVAQGPGEVCCEAVEASAAEPALAAHHLDAPRLLALARVLYGAAPSHTLLLTVGAESVEMGEQLSACVTAALPAARRQIEAAINRLLEATTVGRG